jgi:Ni/Co efflux regulator RcnB
MKRTLTSILALSLVCGGAGVASAQGHNHGDRGHSGYQQQNGWASHSDWRRGGHLARSDWQRGQVVDYRSHHLRAPPRGYEWREVNGRYVMAAVASGIIADIIMNSR